MHCGNCGNTTVEVRPCHIEGHRDTAMRGDLWVCHECAKSLFRFAFRGSDFTTWLGYPCDSCKRQSAFDGAVAGMPEGIVCDQCSVPELLAPDRGMWLCIDCYEKDHFGHRQKELQPILERLSKL